MTSKHLKIACVIFMLMQLYTGIHVFMAGNESEWGRFLLVLFGFAVIIGLGALMIFTGLILYKGHEKTVQRDFYALVVIGVFTFFPFAFATGIMS